MNDDKSKSDLGIISEAIRNAPMPTKRNQELELFLSTILSPKRINQVGLTNIGKAWDAAERILASLQMSAMSEVHPEAIKILPAYKIDIVIDILVVCFGMKEE